MKNSTQIGRYQDMVRQFCACLCGCIASSVSALLRLGSGDLTPCRFEPSCSKYLSLSIERHGVFVGVLEGIKRVARCRPGGGVGYDPVRDGDGRAFRMRSST